MKNKNTTTVENNNSNTVTAETTATGSIQNLNSDNEIITATSDAVVAPDVDTVDAATETISPKSTTNANTSTTISTPSLDSAMQQLNNGSPSWDLFLVGFFVIGAGLYGLSLGKDRIVTIMISIYMALAVVAALPQFVLNVKINSSVSIQVTAFFSVFVILFFFLSRQAVLNSLSPSGHGKWWQVIAFSFLHVGLLLSVTLSFLPPQLLTKFSPLAQFIFTSEWPKFGWIMAPIAAMIFIGKNPE